MLGRMLRSLLPGSGRSGAPQRLPAGEKAAEDEPALASESEDPRGDKVVADYARTNPLYRVEFAGESLAYYVPNPGILWRARTLLLKEPCTIAWLLRIEPGAVLLDIGANIGLYSIFAAAVRNAQVHAFEPESQNYAQLNRNIHLNAVQDRVRAYCIGMSDHSGFEQLHLSAFGAGGSCHELGAAVGHDLKPRAAAFTQGAYALSIDEAVASGAIPVPGYIKIDVDGFEHKVLEGARTTLADARVKSVIVELNSKLEEHRAIVDLLAALGFRHDPEQVRLAERTEGVFEGTAEWIFERGGADEGETTAPAHVFPSRFARPDAALLERVGGHVLKRIRATEFCDEPFPHLVVDEVFPRDYYAEMASQFPRDEQLVPLSETGRTAGFYRERLTLLINRQGFSRLDAAQQRFWGGLCGWLQSPQFLNAVLQAFLPVLGERLSELRTRLGRIDALGDTLLVSDRSRYAIAPHTDVVHRLITFLFYLPADARYAPYGTTLYRPRDPALGSDGSQHLPFDAFEPVKTVEFVPNRLLLFGRSDRSFHGVPSIDVPDIVRPLLINNVRLARS